MHAVGEVHVGGAGGAERVRFAARGASAVAVTRGMVGADVGFGPQDRPRHASPADLAHENVPQKPTRDLGCRSRVEARGEGARLHPPPVSPRFTFDQKDSCSPSASPSGAGDGAGGGSPGARSVRGGRSAWSRISVSPPRPPRPPRPRPPRCRRPPRSPRSPRSPPSPRSPRSSGGPTTAVGPRGSSRSRPPRPSPPSLPPLPPRPRPPRPPPPPRPPRRSREPSPPLSAAPPGSTRGTSWGLTGTRAVRGGKFRSTPTP